MTKMVAAKLVGSAATQVQGALDVTSPIAGKGPSLIPYKSRNVADKISDYVSILDYAGADPTGLTSSDAAWAAAKATGKNVFFPAGLYSLTSFSPASNQTVFGEGFKTKIIGGNVTGLAIYLSGENMWVQDLWLHTTLACFGAVASLHQDIKNSGVRRCKMTDAGFNNNGVKIVVDNSVVGVNGFTVEDNIIENPGRMGVEFQNHGAGSWTLLQRPKVIRNTITNAGSAGANGMGISMSGPQRYSHVQYNDIDGYTAVGIEFIGPSYSFCADNKIIGGSGRPWQFANTTLMVGNKVTGNTIVGGPNTTDVFISSAAYSDFSDNLIDLRASTSYVNVTGGAVGNGWNTFNNNRILTAGSYALINDGTPGNEYTSNKFDNSASTNNFSTLRFINAASTRCVGKGNSIRKGTGGSTWDQTGGAVGNINLDFINRSGTVDVVVNGAGGATDQVAVSATDIPAAVGGVPGSITVTVTSTTSSFGRSADWAYSVAISASLIIRAQAKSGTVDVVFMNPTASVITLPAGTLSVSTRLLQ